MPSRKYLIVISGPTASGKTGLAIQLAQHFSAPILSADSRQFYREMRIGNARPTAKELAQARHHFIADRSITEPLSAGEFAREALALLDEHYAHQQWAIVVGGSGLFLRALTQGLDQFPPIADTTRAAIDQLFLDEGLAGLQAALKKADPAYFAEVDQQNPARLRRALEVCRTGPYPYSHYRQQKKVDLPFIPIFIQTHWPRSVLYERIDHRVDVMIEAGLEMEARNLLPYQSESALRTVGYQEWFPYFKGEYDRVTAIELIKRNSRRYAKRQLTWLRRDGFWKHSYQADLRSALSYIQLVVEQELKVETLKGDELDEWRDNVQLPQPKRLEELVVGLYKEGDDFFPAWCRVLRIPRKGGLLSHWQWLADHHLANAILLHECCHSVELEQLFAQVPPKEQSFFLSKGWISVSGDEVEIPPVLKQEAGKGVWLSWRRADQAF